MFDPERLFCSVLEEFQLKEKALYGNLICAITGDGAAVCNSTNTASQSLHGFKLIDSDAINPVTGEPLLCVFIDDDDDNKGTATRRVFHCA